MQSHLPKCLIPGTHFAIYAYNHSHYFKSTSTKQNTLEFVERMQRNMASDDLLDEKL